MIEEFERKIWKMGYFIVAMNHYVVNGKRHTYCAILNKNRERTAFKFEAKSSERVFESVYKHLSSYTKKSN